MNAMDAVGEIVRDLKDRRGLRQAWEAIDPATQREIERAWAAIVDRQIRILFAEQGVPW